MQWPVSAKAVIEHNGAVLLARNDRAEWELPGGRVELGEEPASAVIREVHEETGLDVTVTALLGVQAFEVVPNRSVLILGFSCSVSGPLDLVLSDEHEALAWHALDRLDDLTLPTVYRDLIAAGTRGRVVLLGDSHLAKFNRARIQQLQDALGDSRLVVNHAYGGATALDLLPQLEQIASHPHDTLVISIGTNDLAHWKRVPFGQFREAVIGMLRLTRSHRRVFLLPPPLDPALQRSARPARTRSHDDQLPYLTELIALTRDSAADVIALPADEIHDTDGVHLNDHGYDLLIALLAELLNAPPLAPGSSDV